jgi:hypothetical protein
LASFRDTLFEAVARTSGCSDFNQPKDDPDEEDVGIPPESDKAMSKFTTA